MCLVCRGGLTSRMSGLLYISYGQYIVYLQAAVPRVVEQYPSHESVDESAPLWDYVNLIRKHAMAIWLSFVDLLVYVY